MPAQQEERSVIRRRAVVLLRRFFQQALLIEVCFPYLRVVHKEVVDLLRFVGIDHLVTHVALFREELVRLLELWWIARDVNLGTPVPSENLAY